MVRNRSAPAVPGQPNLVLGREAVSSPARQMDLGAAPFKQACGQQGGLQVQGGASGSQRAGAVGVAAATGGVQHDDLPAQGRDDRCRGPVPVRRR